MYVQQNIPGGRTLAGHLQARWGDSAGAAAGTGGKRGSEQVPGPEEAESSPSQLFAPRGRCGEQRGTTVGNPPPTCFPCGPSVGSEPLAALGFTVTPAQLDRPPFRVPLGARFQLWLGLS